MIFERLERIEHKLNEVLRRLNQLAVDQATFDQHLQELASGIDELVNAVQSKLNAQPDFTEEDAALQAASQKVKDAMDTINPNVPDPAPADAPVNEGSDAPPADDASASEEQPVE